MRRPSSPERSLPPEDDPNSELNLLRREVRQLQAAVRDAALQIATLEENTISLRKSLSVTESELEDSLARENTLRSQLETQRLKKEHIETTMAAAEALVDSLREVVLEQHTDAPELAPELAPDVALPQKAPQPSGADDLDLLLSRISDGAQHANPTEHPSAESTTTHSVDSSRIPDPQIFPQHDVNPPARDLLEDRITGNTASPIEPSFAANQRPLDDTILASPKFRPTLRSPPSPPPRHRHSMPVSRVSRRQPAQPRQTSTLLLSAFGKTNASTNNQGHAIHSSGAQSGDELPAEIISLAKGEEALRRNAPRLPSTIRCAVDDAHSGEIYAIASSADGNWIATGGDDRIIKVYDSSGIVLGSISELNRSVTSLAFSPDVQAQGADQNIIFAGSSDGSVRSFRKQRKRRAKWTLASVYPVHTQTVRKMILTDDKGVRTNAGKVVLSCSTDRTIKISDVESGEKRFSVSTQSAVLDVDGFGGNGRGVLVSGHKDGGIRTWSTQGEKASLASAKIHTKAVVSVCCLEDGYGVVSLGRDNVLRLSDIRNGVSVVRELDGMVETVSDWHSAQVHNRDVACGIGRSGELGIWNVDSGRVVRKISSHTSESRDDVLDMVARKLRSPGCIVGVHWTVLEGFVCTHRTRQVSFWDSM